MNKLYSVHDHWTDIGKKNDVDIESIDGVITGIKVNGEDYGGGETWNTVFEGSVTTVDDDGDIVGIIENLTLNGNSIRVTFNNTVYELPKTEHGYGAENESGIDFSTYPLFIATGEGVDSCTLWTPTAGTYSLKIEEQQSGGGGESDFSTAEIDVTINGERTFYIGNAVFINEEEMYLVGGFETATYTIVLYKGTFKGVIATPEGYKVSSATGTDGVTVLTIPSGSYAVDITGNGTLTVDVTRA